MAGRFRPPRRLRLAAFTMVLLAVFAPASGRAADDFKVVVSAKSPPAAFKRQELARMFLKKETRWPDGQAVVPVDQSSRTPVRTAFTRGVLATEGLTQMSAVENYWQRLLFSGRGTPPSVVASDAEVLAFVAATPGAIGYVSGSAATGDARVVPVGN